MHSCIVCAGYLARRGLIGWLSEIAPGAPTITLGEMLVEPEHQARQILMRTIIINNNEPVFSYLGSRKPQVRKTLPAIGSSPIIANDNYSY